MVDPVTIATGITTAIAWFNSLPDTFKYIIFLTGLLADASLLPAIFGLDSGLIASFINIIVNFGFNFPLFHITSWQLLIVFIMLPIIFYCFKH